MPGVQVYAVDFSQGELAPWLDTNNWGPMLLGTSSPGSNTTSSAEPQGLGLSLVGDGSAAAAIGAYVVLNQGQLDLATRLLLHVEFDRVSVNPPSGAGRPEPWAVALNVKLGNETYVDNEAMVPVTCQFQPFGVRLNTPAHLEGDQPTPLLTPLDYGSMTSDRFVMEHHFCGMNTTRGHSIGFGSLTVGPPGQADKPTDQRVYSSNRLSCGRPQAWIGALGAALATVQGAGQISVRLRNFSISTWS